MVLFMPQYSALGTTPGARSPLHDWQVRNGGKFSLVDGWQIPTFSSNRELAATRNGLALADLSPFAKLSLVGPGVTNFVQSGHSGAQVLKPLGVCPWSGDSNILACRLNVDHVLLLASTMDARLFDPIKSQLPRDGSMIANDVTTGLAGFALIGERGQELLNRLTHLNLTPQLFPESSCAETNLAGVHALLIRSARGSHPSFRIYVAWDLAEYVWETLLESGQNLTPIDLETWQALHSSQ